MSWVIGVEDLNALAIGAAILGTGGGGDPDIGRLMAEAAMTENGPVVVLDVNELEDMAWVIPIAGMGAPTVLFEKPPRGTEPVDAFTRLERHLGVSGAYPSPIEAGGINSMVPLLVAASLKRPVVDADGMGRAFPELYMQTFHIHGISGTPACIVNEFGDDIILDHLHDNYALEWIARGITIRLGGHSFVSQFPMRGYDVKRAAIRGTLSLGLRIGRAVLRAQHHHADAVDAICAATAYAGYGRGKTIFRGKIVEVSRRTADGFARGVVTLDGAEANRGDRVCVEFQNENLIARRGNTILATVPDLITIVDSTTGLAITTERLRYGQRVVVLQISAPAIMKSSEALAVWGPRGFGFDFDYE